MRQDATTLWEFNLMSTAASQASDDDDDAGHYFT